MKKLAIILALLMVPFSAFALDTISDSDLNDVTGQSGVSIFLNTIRIEKTDWTTGYGDETGTTAFGADTNWVMIQDEGSTKEISFLGSRTLDIDIVSRAEFTVAVAGGDIPGVASADAARFGNLGTSGQLSTSVSDVAVVISLPNGIQIADFGTTKAIYLGQTAGAVGGVGSLNDNGATNARSGAGALLIKTFSGGGTTTITGAGGAAAANNVHIGIMAHE